MGYSKVQTIIGEGTEIKGSIQATGVARIDGTLEGSIDHAGDLIIGPKGRVLAEIRSKNLAVAGEVRGNAHVEQKLELLPGARYYGDVRMGCLVIQDGAMFYGRSQMLGDKEDTEHGSKSEPK
ncbi:MAG TPA: polymer-forming cytoskeletal protein [Symbiobacteriaceae bacterium]|nr:polymer-forming cytoskeletal protein [Symbiobacteriaceae bacterium]